MDEESIKEWDASIDENKAEIINRIFRNVNIKEHGYNSALSVLKLSKPYSEKRLEIVCEIALTSIRVPRYQIALGNRIITTVFASDKGDVTSSFLNVTGFSGYLLKSKDFRWILLEVFCDFCN